MFNNDFCKLITCLYYLLVIIVAQRYMLMCLSSLLTANRQPLCCWPNVTTNVINDFILTLVNNKYFSATSANQIFLDLSIHNFIINGLPKVVRVSYVNIVQFLLFAAFQRIRKHHLRCNYSFSTVKFPILTVSQSISLLLEFLSQLIYYNMEVN